MTVEAHIKVGAGSPGSEERKEIQHGEASGLCQFRPLPGRLIQVEMSRVFSVTRRQPPEPVGIDLEFGRDEYDQGGDFTCRDLLMELAEEGAADTMSLLQ